jgi:hypothetical protein
MDGKQLALEIIDGPVFEMYTPLAKLKAISELVYAATDSNRDLEVDKLNGLGEILTDVSENWENLIEKANDMHKENRDK